MKNLDSILEDLYAIDPSFKKEEKELKKVIQELLKAKPNLKINESFILQLREKLNKEATNLNPQEPSPLPSDPSPSMFKKIFFPFAGGILATAIVVLVINNLETQSLDQSVEMSSQTESLFSMNNQVIEVEPEAFGPLSELNISSAPERNSIQTGGAPQAAFEDVAQPPKKESSSAFISAPSPGGVNLSNNVQIDSAMQVDISPDSIATNPAPAPEGKIAPDMLMVPPDYTPTIYKYIYKGEPLSLSEQTVNVFKRLPQKANSGALANTLKNFGFGLIDLSAFQNIRVNSVSLTQDEALGYEIGLNFLDSSINLYQNSLGWDYPGSKCKEDQNCYEQTRIKKEDIPDDERLKTMANDFLEAHQVNLTNYGEPVIQKYWEKDTIAYKQQGLPESDIYYPDTINLVYPILLEGKPSYDQWGNPLGLNVGVNFYNKKVSSLYGLQTSQFQSSAYEAVTDWKTIEESLSKGGISDYNYYGDSRVNIKEIELGAPEEVLISIWNYDETKNESGELYTPGLKFPIIQPDGEYIYREYVVVPLAKELLEQNEVGRPIPLMKTLENQSSSSNLIPPGEPSTTPIEPPSIPAVPKG